MKFDRIQIQILEDVMQKQENNGKGEDAPAFRVKYLENRKDIDKLTEQKFLKKDQDKYFLLLKGVQFLNTPQSKTTLIRLNWLLKALKSHYKQIFGRETSLMEIKSKYAELEVSAYDFLYLNELNIFSTLSYGNNSFSFNIKEDILDLKDLESLKPNNEVEKVAEKNTEPKSETRWKLGDGIGGGGQGDVFMATDRTKKNSTNYAYKKLKNKNRVNRFKNEAEAILSLSHKNIIQIVDHNTDEEAASQYIVYEYCEGKSLDKVGPFNFGEAFQIFLEVCSGLQAAHDIGIYHRDIKPANILLRQQRKEAVVADFGLCYIENNNRETEHHEAVGPRIFMAPELEDGKLDSVTAACDVYSLGKLLYWLLSGGKIFSREKHRKINFDLVKIKNDVRYEHINKLLDHMLKSDPSDRVENAGTVFHAASHILKLFEGNYHANTPDTKEEKCNYCGIGIYNLIADQGVDGVAIKNFGINNVSGNRLVIYGCSQCGHIQMFRPDLNIQSGFWLNLKTRRE